MKKHILTFSLLLSFVFAMAQSITLTFSAEDQNGNPHEFSTVKVENLTRNWQHYLNYPNTTLVLQITDGIIGQYGQGEELSVIGPNPFKGTAYAELQLTEAGPVEVKALQMDGKLVAQYEGILPVGTHRITFNAATPQMYILVATTSQGCYATKLMNTGYDSKNCIEVTMLSEATEKNSTKSRDMGYFIPGDQMRYTAYSANAASNALTQQQYGSENIVLQFTVTPSAELPVVVTNNVTNIDASSATISSEVISDGGATVTERGVCWSTQQNPTISGSHTSNGAGVGTFNVNINGLASNTLYYVRAYATNSVGTAYGTTKTFTTLEDFPTGAIHALYSVGSAEKVYFSQGNLQYQPCFYTWRFAESQLDYIGSNNANISTSYSGWIDLFGWGTGDNPINTSLNNDNYTTFTNWGDNPISNGGNQANQWRTLTKEEWQYMMFTRITASGIRFAMATVNGKFGVIILPDNWSSSYYSLSSTNNVNASFSTNNIPLTYWTSVFEAHGAVFLPAAGNRKNKTINDVGTKGYYWTSTPKNTYSNTPAYRLSFTNGHLELSDGDNYYGNSVRLVGPYLSSPHVVTTCNVVFRLTNSYDGSGSWHDSYLTVTFDDGTPQITLTGGTNNILTITKGTTVTVKFTAGNIYPNEVQYVVYYEDNPNNPIHSDGLNGIPSTTPWSFTVDCAGTIPYVLTQGVTNIGANSALGNGEVVMEGGAPVTERGICFSTDPTAIENHIACSSAGTGAFSVNLEGLLPNTTYYVRAYATNSIGTGYGEPMSFTTFEGGIGNHAKYSVSATQKVYFSQGNLQYKASTNTWRFAEHQWDYVGTQIPDSYGYFGGNVSGSDNANISPTYNGWIDLFGWGTGNNPTNSSTDNSNYSSFTDWGCNPISNGGNQANQWRTLTKDEWNYLIFTRTTSSGIRYAKATVNGVAGLIILPDDWSTTYYTLNTTSTAYTANTISLANWNNIFEANGAVFLPAAGNRIGTTIYLAGNEGCYWSSQPYETYEYEHAYILFHNSNYLEMSVPNRHRGISVRLVMEAN